MAKELSAREWALRKLPLPYSLASRLRDAGVAPDVVCEYNAVEELKCEDNSLTDSTQMRSTCQPAERPYGARGDETP
jgi:hypothetical protein